MTHQNKSELLNSVLQLLTEDGTDGVAEGIRLLVNEAMQQERSKALQAQPYERTDTRQGHANGFKPKTLATRVGPIQFKIPQVRGDLDFYPSALEKGIRSEQALKPIFYSRKNHTFDNQRLATTKKPLGTTFSIFSLDSFFLSQGRRQGHTGGQARLVCLAYDLAAQHEMLALKHRFDFLQIIQSAQDFRPFPVRPFLLQALFQSALEQLGQKTA